jgi:hypothetical protein
MLAKVGVKRTREELKPYYCSKAKCRWASGAGQNPSAAQRSTCPTSRTSDRCGPFLHDDPRDRPPAIFSGATGLHFGGLARPYLLLPIIPPKKK